MLTVFLRTIKIRFWATLVYIIVGVLFVWMFVGMFPSFADKADDLNQLMELYPEKMMEAFGVKDAVSIFASVENFLAVENYSFLWPILAIALAISLGGFSVAGEIERKTIEFLLAQPISRSGLFWGKYLAGLVILGVFSATTVFVAVPLAHFYGVEYNLEAHTKVFVLGFLFVWAVFSLATFLSTLFCEKSKAYFISIGLLVVMYAVNLVALLKEEWENLGYISFFHYFDTAKALGEGAVDQLSVIVFGAVAVLFACAALIVFSERDITVS